MNILFWNIGKRLSQVKCDLLGKIIDDSNPEIFCIAEGSGSIKKCQDLVNLFSNKGYDCFYNPLFYKAPVVSNEYGWNNLGLKVFIKKNSNYGSTFSFDCQKFDGRILNLNLTFKMKGHSLFFIHNKSKLGEEFDQRDFIIELSNFIKTKIRTKPKESVIILGDFNIEPWSELLTKKSYINSCFHKKWFTYYSSKINVLKSILYYNPFFELLSNNQNSELIGTFYNRIYYGLIDYALFSNNIKNYTVDVITKIDTTELLIKKGKKCFLVYDFDHLPILINLK